MSLRARMLRRASAWGSRSTMRVARRPRGLASLLQCSSVSSARFTGSSISLDSRAGARTPRRGHEIDDAALPHQPHRRPWVAAPVRAFRRSLPPDWFVGLVLLWLSEAWATAEKLVGTLLVPGGLLAAFPRRARSARRLHGVMRLRGRPGNRRGVWCRLTGRPSLAARIIWIVLFVVCVVGPFFTTAFLATRMRRPAAAGYRPSPGSV